jgi:uncharacterized protein (UPF0332 family)/predicted nucleotidyltransferase
MSTLADALLSAPERRALERFARELERELGNSLRGAWLYGSRARGERTGPESDVDLLVITDRARRRDRVQEMLDQAADAEGANRFFFSIQVYDLDWLAERRGVEAFFVKEVDRDRIVLAGDPEGLPGARAPAPELQPGEMRPRTKELLEEARERIDFARLGVGADVGTPVVSIAYYAALDAARAALSEEDRHTRSHKGTWGLFRETFVVTGRFDARLHAAAHAVQKKREYADYAPVRYTPEEARNIVETCERFVAAVEAMLGVESE